MILSSPVNLSFTFFSHLDQSFKEEMVSSQMHVWLIEEAVKTDLEVCMLCKLLEVHRVSSHNMGNLKIFVRSFFKIVETFMWSERYFV